MRVIDKDLPVSDELVAALSAATTMNTNARTIEPMVSLLQRFRFNQKEFVRVCNAFCSNSSLGKDSLDKLLIELMKNVARGGQRDDLKTDIQLMAPYFDDALVKHYSKLRSAGVSNATWLQQHKSLCEFVMDASDLQAVLHCAGNWAAVAAALGRLCSTSRLGQSVFRIALTMVSSGKFEQEIEGLLDELMQESSVTPAAVEKFKQKALILEGTYKSAGFASTKRELQISFLGSQVPVVVSDLGAETQFRCAARLKTVALQQQGLDKLPYEDVIFPGKAEAKITIHESVLADMQACRKIAKELCSSSNVSSFGDMRAILQGKADQLVSLDRTFVLELQYISMSAEGVLQNAVQDQMLLTLPTATKAVTFAQSSHALAQLKGSDAVKLSNAATKAQLDTVEEVIANLQRGLAPQQSFGANGGFFEKVALLLPNFQRVAVSSASDEMPSELVGAAALQHKFSAFQSRYAKDSTSISLGELETFQAFK
jgi:hypothetical protein